MQRGLSLDSRKHVTSKLVEMRPDHAQDKQPSPTPLTFKIYLLFKQNMEMPFQQALSTKSLIHDLTDHRSAIVNTNLYPHIRGAWGSVQHTTHSISQLTLKTTY